MATHSSILAWKIPRTEETSGLQSMGSQRVGHDWATHTTTTGMLWPQVVRFLLGVVPNVFFLKHFQFFLYSEDTVVVVAVQSQSCLTLWPQGLQHARLPCPSLSLRVCSDSCLLSQWCHPNISSSVAPFSCCPQSFLASGSFPMSWLFASGGQSIGASASALVLPMNIQGWYPLGFSGMISLLYKGLFKSLLGLCQKDSSIGASLRSTQ